MIGALIGVASYAKLVPQRWRYIYDLDIIVVDLISVLLTSGYYGSRALLVLIFR
jgi:hypothetical protein